MEVVEVGSHQKGIVEELERRISIIEQLHKHIRELEIRAQPKKWKSDRNLVSNRIVTAFYNLGVLLIATGTFKEGIDFSVGVGIDVFIIACGLMIDWMTERKKET